MKTGLLNGFWIVSATKPDPHPESSYRTGVPHYGWGGAHAEATSLLAQGRKVYVSLYGEDCVKVENWFDPATWDEPTVCDYVRRGAPLGRTRCGRPEMSTIVEHLWALAESWRDSDPGKRSDFQFEYYTRDKSFSLPHFWDEQWRKWAPRIFQIGYAVEWKHGREQWAPYRVHGLKFDDKHQVHQVVLLDDKGTHWDAWPKDITEIGS